MNSLENLLNSLLTLALTVAPVYYVVLATKAF